MIDKKTLLTILNQYGFNSIDKEPYLYIDNNLIGLYYTIKHPLYGYLNRIFLPQTIEELKEFLINFNQYKKQKDNELIFSLTTYNDLYAKPIFTPNPEYMPTKPLTPVIKKEPIKTYNHKELRTSILLLEILENKLQLNQITSQNTYQLLSKYHNLLEKFYIKLSELTKQKNIEKLEPLKENEVLNINNILTPLKNELKTITKEEEMTSYIYKIIFHIKELEQEEAFIHNKYLLIIIPLKISTLEDQITYLEQLLEKPKKRFTKKIPYQKELDKIQNESQLNKIVSYETFYNNEQKRISEKYEMLEEMDLTTIADYLIEFDNLNIKEPNIKKEPIKKEEPPKPEEKVTFETAMQNLETEFNSRSPKEQNSLYILTSFLRKILKKPMSNSQLNEEEKQLLKIINNPNNILAKIKIFKDFDTKDEHNLLNNLYQLYSNILQTKPFELKSDIHVFLKESEPLLITPFLIASSKKKYMPILDSKNSDLTYIIKLKKNSYIYFSPNELTIDISNDDQIILQKNHPLFIIDPHFNNIIFEECAIISVDRYKVTQEQTSPYVIITKVNKIETDYYKTVTIERKEAKND